MNKREFEAMPIVAHTFAKGSITRYRNVEGTFFQANTPFEVVLALRAVAIRSVKVRFFFGDPETGLDWNEEHDVVGYLGRSIGPIKVPLLLKSQRSDGGPALLDHCIVKLVDRDGSVLWQHPSYRCRAFSIAPSDLCGYAAVVQRAGEIIARFRKPGQAEKWVAFLRGERLYRN